MLPAVLVWQRHCAAAEQRQTRCAISLCQPAPLHACHIAALRKPRPLLPLTQPMCAVLHEGCPTNTLRRTMLAPALVVACDLPQRCRPRQPAAPSLPTCSRGCAPTERPGGRCMMRMMRCGCSRRWRCGLAAPPAPPAAEPAIAPSAPEASPVNHHAFIAGSLCHVEEAGRGGHAQACCSSPRPLSPHALPFAICQGNSQADEPGLPSPCTDAGMSIWSPRETKIIHISYIMYTLYISYIAGIVHHTNLHRWVTCKSM